MMDLQSHLTTLLSLPAIPGNDELVCEVLRNTWKPWVDDISISKLGSLHALKNGSGSEPRKKLMVTAHMDGVGMIVTGLVDGFIAFTDVGYLDARVLPGQEVMVHGREDIPGVIVDPGERLLPVDVKDKTTPIKYLWIDTGVSPEALATVVRVGDPISYSKLPVPLEGGWLMGHTLDNRASLAAISVCLELLQASVAAWDVWIAATVQEEITHAGAITSGWSIQPDMAIVLDTTYGKLADGGDHLSFPLGGGPALGIGPNIHPVLHQRFKRLADELEVPNTIEVLPGNSLTDAHALQVVAAGIPCMVISIPILNMHTAIEVVALKDIQRTGVLVARWIEALGLKILDPCQVEDAA